MRGLILEFIFLFYHIQNKGSPFFCTRIFEVKKYCDNYVISSKKQDKNDQKVLNCSLFPFPLLSNEDIAVKIESTPWNWIWNAYSFGIIWKILQKLHRPTFMSVFSSNLEVAFAAEFLLDQINFFKPQDIGSYSYSIIVVVLWKNWEYVWTSEPQTLRLALTLFYVILHY